MYIMALTLGNHNGVSQMPGAFVVGGKVTSSIKGKTFFAERIWKELGFENVPEQPLFWDDPSISLEQTYLSDETLTRFAGKTGLTRTELVGFISGKWAVEEQKS